MITIIIISKKIIIIYYLQHNICIVPIKIKTGQYWQSKKTSIFRFPTEQHLMPYKVIKTRLRNCRFLHTYSPVWTTAHTCTHSKNKSEQNHRFYVKLNKFFFTRKVSISPSLLFNGSFNINLASQPPPLNYAPTYSGTKPLEWVVMSQMPTWLLSKCQNMKINVPT